jgi:two-component system heavy metal sensor histidine kinase CusS
LLALHEFVLEPRAYGADRHPAEAGWVPFVELAIYGAMPVVLLIAWLQIRRRLQPLHAIAREIDSWDPESGLNTPRPKADSPEAAAVAAALARASERLRKSFGEIREFSLRAAHEIKTPLTVLRGHAEAEVRRAEQAGDTGLANRIGLQIAEIDRLARLVDSLGFLAKTDAGLVTFHLKPERLDALVAEFLEDVRAMAEDGGITVTAQIDQPALATYDAQRLRQVFLALADNAVKYNRPGGEIVLGTFHSPPESGFWIENESPFLAPGEATQVFEPFFRGSRCRAQTEGSGLGLSIARSVVEAQAGRLVFAVLSPGRVRTTVFLPSARLDPGAQAKPVPPGPENFGAGI